MFILIDLDFNLRYIIHYILSSGYFYQSTLYIKGDFFLSIYNIITFFTRIGIKTNNISSYYLKKNSLFFKLDNLNYSKLYYFFYFIDLFYLFRVNLIILLIWLAV